MSDLTQAAADVQAAESTEAAAEKKARVQLTPEQRLQKLKQKLEELPNEIAELEAEIASASLLASAGVNTQVTLTLGKGETLRTVPGVIIAVRDEEDGSRLYRVAYGSGFDADVVTVTARKIRLA